MQIRTFTGGWFGENAYLAVCTASGSCVAVDPGAAAPDLLRSVADDGLDLVAVLLTHGHIDHIEGVSVVRDGHPDVPIWLHPDDLALYRGVAGQAAMFGLPIGPQPEPTDRLAEGQRFTFGACGFEVRFAPGHAPGHVLFVSTEDRLALSGDLVFQGSIGRFDLPGGDLDTLMASIDTQVMSLPDETVLYPGHGPVTTVGRERASNPFIQAYRDGELA